MKKQLIAILSIMLIFVFGISLTISAADYAVAADDTTVTIKADKTEVNPGDTFTITISGSAEAGINGLTGSLSYDKDQLELVSAKSVDTEKWSSLGQNSEGNIEIAIIANSSDIKSGNIFEVTFKVKDSVERGTVIKVTPSNIVLDTLAETDSEYKAELGDVEVKVKEEASKPDNTTKPSIDNTTSENATNNTTPENKTEYKTIENKNSTQSQAKTMPYTGTNMFVAMSVVAVGIVAIVSYASYKRYKNI